MAIEIFNRYENKYLVKEEIFRRLTDRLVDYMIQDAYSKKDGQYPIYNIYYDTRSNDLIRTSLMKPAYKEKLRVRSYGKPDANAMIYVEIKKKANGIVNKRRTSMKPAEAYGFLNSGELPSIKPYMNPQVLREIEYMLKQNILSPALFLSYERQAYFEDGAHDLRVSFDTNIRTRRTDLWLESGAYGEELLEKGEWLMEIKTAQSIPLWLCRLLSEYKIYPTGFSKYGAEYKRALGRIRRSYVVTPQWSDMIAAEHIDLEKVQYV
ncbi:MAG: polyphosphate polymerase domain-containing protein [Clostridiales bacterium]|nr:polyphosphate polymerase domain-containing protein [Clostridiales bacterium]